MATFQGEAPDLMNIPNLPVGAVTKYAPAATSNYTVPTGNITRLQKAIVLHTPEGTALSACNTIQNPGSRVSYHYLVAENGDIIQFVRDIHTAWHVSPRYRRQLGLNPPVWWNNDYGQFVTEELSGSEFGNIYNNVTLGVALAGHADTIHETMPIDGVQWQSFIALMTLLCRKYQISHLGSWIIGHNHLNNNRTDPGRQFPWTEMRIALKYAFPQGQLPFYPSEIFFPPERTAEELVEGVPASDEELDEPQFPIGLAPIPAGTIPRRRAELEVGHFQIIPVGTRGITREFTLDPLVVNDSLRIRFSITHSFEENESPWWIEVYNMANATGQRVIDRGTNFSISAGYNEPGLICEGVIQNVKISREGANTITRLLATGLDSSPDINGFISSSWPAGTPVRALFEEIAKQLGFTLSSTDHIPQIATRKLTQPYSLSIQAKRGLDVLLERYGLVASFFCGQLVLDQASPIINPGLPNFEPGHLLTERERREFEQDYTAQVQAALAVRISQAFTLNEHNGMIGVPSRTETGVEVETILNPAVTLTRLLNIESRWLNGLYHLTKVTHSGDTWSGEFRTKAVGEPVDQRLEGPFNQLTGIG